MKHKKECNMIHKENDKRIISLDILRVFACFLVCYCHIVSESQYIYKTEMDINLFFTSITFIFSKIAVPIFFMISGALLLKEERTTKKMLNKAVKKILVPLFICSIVIYFKDNLNLNISNIINFTEKFLNNQILSPYWYLYSLLGIYVMTPYISNFVQNISQKKYRELILIGFIFVVILETIEILNIKLSSSFSISLTTNFYYYLLGDYIFNKCKINKKIMMLTNICAIIVFILFIPFVFENKIELLGNINLLLIFTITMSIFISIKYLCENHNIPHIIERVIKFISPLTYCIYLIHVIFLGKLKFILEFLMTYINDVIAIIIYSGTFFGCMIIISYLIRKIPYVKEYI